MFASQEGRTDIVELLIKHNADVNARTEVRLHIYITLIEKWETSVRACVQACVCSIIIEIYHHMLYTMLLVCSSRPGRSIVKVIQPQA